MKFQGYSVQLYLKLNSFIGILKIFCLLFRNTYFKKMFQ